MVRLAYHTPSCPHFGPPARAGPYVLKSTQARGAYAAPAGRARRRAPGAQVVMEGKIRLQPLRTLALTLIP